MTISVERLAAEDQAWREWARASAAAQNKYYPAWKAAHDAFRDGGDVGDLMSATAAALAAKRAAIAVAGAAYRKAMENLPQ